jgi:hypothetical protein
LKRGSEAPSGASLPGRPVVVAGLVPEYSRFFGSFDSWLHGLSEPLIQLDYWGCGEIIAVLVSPSSSSPRRNRMGESRRASLEALFEARPAGARAGAPGSFNCHREAALAAGVTLNDIRYLALDRFAMTASRRDALSAAPQP